MEAPDSLQLNSQYSHNVRERAQWERSRVITFCDICKRELENGNRSGGSLKKFVWTSIATKFKNETGLTYDSQQMKHKWDMLKKEWKNWRILKRLATGLGWNPRKGTIDATDDWWDRNIKANPEIAKFRAKGIDPELEDKLGFLFDDTAEQIKNDRRYMPHFKDCIGAIDGTHIPASIPVTDQLPISGEKGCQRKT
ncbi:unnamed protein product [Cuscuta campestris]|uniref:Myb/SANT-like domain-containing protein n=1 Tax=Cuscuta campestris TaxID=132261 RepID=A0A484KXM1_9ASTE|nr:unnamed protein product [Cuscuta campestris]